MQVWLTTGDGGSQIGETQCIVSWKVNKIKTIIPFPCISFPCVLIYLFVIFFFFDFLTRLIHKTFPRKVKELCKHNFKIKWRNKINDRESNWLCFCLPILIYYNWSSNSISIVKFESRFKYELQMTLWNQVNPFITL